MKNKKTLICIFIASAALTGCSTEEEKQTNFEIKDCQSSVLGLLDSGFNAVISDAITLEETASETEKMRLSAEICKHKNPMYFRN